MQTRNKFYSHNDPENSTVFIYFDEKESRIKATSQMGFHYFFDRKELILSLLNKIRSQLEIKRDECLALLYGEANGYQVSVTQSFTLSFYSGFFENRVERDNKSRNLNQKN